MEGKTLKINPYQENSFFFVGVICPMRAVKGELQHPLKLWQPRTAKSMGTKPGESCTGYFGVARHSPLCCFLIAAGQLALLHQNSTSIRVRGMIYPSFSPSAWFLARFPAGST